MQNSTPESRVGNRVAGGNWECHEALTPGKLAPGANTILVRESAEGGFSPYQAAAAFSFVGINLPIVVGKSIRRNSSIAVVNPIPFSVKPSLAARMLGRMLLQRRQPGRDGFRSPPERPTVRDRRCGRIFKHIRRLRDLPRRLRRAQVSDPCQRSPCHCPVVSFHAAALGSRSAFLEQVATVGDFVDVAEHLFAVRSAIPPYHPNCHQAA